MPKYRSKITRLVKDKNGFSVGVCLSSILLILTGLFIYKNIKLIISVNEKPSSIIVANKTTSTADIYWKSSKDNGTQYIEYKETEYTGLYKTIESTKIGKDNDTNKYIYTVSIDGLKDNKEYTFRIKTENNKWKEDTFTTKQATDTIDFPDIISGTRDKEKLLLIDISGDTHIINTQEHGTWAFDSSGKNYTITEYADYAEEQTVSLFNKLFDAVSSEVYAGGTANCATGASATGGITKVGTWEINNAEELKKKVVERAAIYRVSGAGVSSNPSLCFADTYCRAVDAGVNPVFTLAIWMHESGASNYDNANGSSTGVVGDFGISVESSRSAEWLAMYGNNYNNQIRQFFALITAKDNYIYKQCNDAQFNSIKEQLKSNSSVTNSKGTAYNSAEVLKEIESDPKLYYYASSYYVGCGTMEYFLMAYEWMQQIKSIYSLLLTYNNSATLGNVDTNLTYASLTDGTVAKALDITCSGAGSTSNLPTVTPSSSSGPGGSTSSGSSSTSGRNNADSGSNTSSDQSNNDDNTSNSDNNQIDESELCGGNKDYMIITNTNKKCEAENGCVCLYGYSNNKANRVLCAENGKTCTTSGDVKTIKETDGVKTQLEVSTTTPSKECTDEDGCICTYDGGTDKEIGKGVICKYTTDGKKTSLTVNETNPSKDCTDVDGCTCTYDGNNSTKEIKNGETCVMPSKTEETTNVCCYYNDELSYISSSYCTTNGTKFSDINEENCTSYKIKINFKEGPNFVQAFEVFDFGTITTLSAKFLMTYSDYKIIAIGQFRNNAWTELVQYNNGELQGNDFNLIPGDVYYFLTTEEYVFTATTTHKDYDSMQINNLSGWNLVPTRLFLENNTTSTSIIQNPDYNITQIAQWDYDTSSFVYTVMDSTNTLYGTDTLLTDQEGVFIKVEKTN